MIWGLSIPPGKPSKRQVKYEQYKTELGFDACQQLYEKHAAETIDIRMMDLSVNATLEMAEEAYASASAMAEEGEMGEMGWEAEMGEMGREAEMGWGAELGWEAEIGFEEGGHFEEGGY